MSDVEKEREQTNKKRIQDEFRSSLNIIVDLPKQGYGSTNDGNTARAVLSNFEVSANILGLDVELVEGLFDLCVMINYGYKIDSIKI